jgi:hypothetical protein
MGRMALTLTAFTATVMAGCLRDSLNSTRPTARGVEPTAATGARLEPPVRLTTGDERKGVREKIQERKDKKATPAEKPMLPSPIAPKETKEPEKPAAKLGPATPVDTPPTPPAAVKSDAPKGELATVRHIHEVAAAQFEKMVDFEAHMVRREVVKGREQPTEELLFQYRKKPFSIYMKNVGEHGRGREVVYVDGQHEGKMHILMGEGDGGIFAKAGTKMAFEPSNPLVTSKSRHKITEAGFAEMVVRFGKVITLTENGTRPGGVKSLGKIERKEYPYALDGVEVMLLPGDDTTLPKGGKKMVYFDMKDTSASYGFPVLVTTHDETGREVEYYCFTQFKNPAKLTDADFDPARLVPKRR